MLTSIISILVVFGLIVAVHEWGHMIAAKLCGVAVPNFALGMGPSLMSRVWRGTRYHICAFPIGGFVTIAGMEGDDPLNDPRRPEAKQDEAALEAHKPKHLDGSETPALALQMGLPALATEEQIEAAEAPEEKVIDVDSLRQYTGPGQARLAEPVRFKTWRDINGFQKAFILVAGPLMNFVLAVIVILSMGLVGFPHDALMITSVQPDTPAAAAGLQAGDLLTHIAGQEISDARQFAALVQASKDSPVVLDFERGGEKMSASATPRVIEGFNKNLASLGVGLEEVAAYLTTDINLVSPGSVADKLGLRIGDKIVQYQDQPIFNGLELLMAMPGIDEQGRALDAQGELLKGDGPGQSIVIERTSRRESESPVAGIKEGGNGDPRVLSVEGRTARIQFTLPSDTSMLSFGVAFKPSLERLPFKESVQRSLRETQAVIIGTLFSLRLLFTEVGLQSVSGPVGIGRMIAQSAHSGIYEMLQILMIINLSLGMLNLMPIPALDGGRLVFVALNGIGLRISERREALVHTVSMVLLLGLIALVSLKDVMAIFSR